MQQQRHLWPKCAGARKRVHSRARAALVPHGVCVRAGCASCARVHTFACARVRTHARTLSARLCAHVVCARWFACARAAQAASATRGECASGILPGRGPEIARFGRPQNRRRNRSAPGRMQVAAEVPAGLLQSRAGSLSGCYGGLASNLIADSESPAVWTASMP